jgi:uncharacterized protein YjaG (DUF416 family)
MCRSNRSERRNTNKFNNGHLAEALTMLRYDEADTIRALAAIPRNSRVAFAAACAERLFPAYEDFCRKDRRGDQAAMAEILERVWKHLLGDEIEAEQIRAELTRCMALIPGEEDEPWIREQAYADDAASAIAYALRTLESGDPQEAAWAARRTYEAADHHVTHRLGIEDETQVLNHPIVQAEFARQRRDLDELRGAKRESIQLFARLRDRARAEARLFFASSL